MKALLIQPPSADPVSDKIFMFEPLALEYLCAGLKLDGHTVELLDARLEPEIEPAFRRFQPQVVGLTGYTSHLNIVKGIAARLKAILPGLFVVVGGAPCHGTGRGLQRSERRCGGSWRRRIHVARTAERH